MADNIKAEDLVEKKDETSSSEAKVETKADVETEAKVEAEQDPLKTELERVKKVSKYSEEEKAEFSFKKQAEKLKELGKDPASILGIKTEEISDEDNQPLTKGEYRKMMAGSVAKTALQEADTIPNETERELVKYHLENTIKSTGIPTEDLKLARALVNAVKNTQIIEETARKGIAKTHSNSSGVDAKQEKEVIYTDEEKKMMHSFKLSPKDILNAREGKSHSFKK